MRRQASESAVQASSYIGECMSSLANSFLAEPEERPEESESDSDEAIAEIIKSLEMIKYKLREA